MGQTSREEGAVMPETKTCRICGKKMIKWSRRMILLSNPPQLSWDWKCGCGYTEYGDAVHGITDEERFHKEWLEAQ